MSSTDNGQSTPTALIIGASRGLGSAMAAEFLDRGWNVLGTVRDTTAHTPLHDLAGRATDASPSSTSTSTSPDNWHPCENASRNVGSTCSSSTQAPRTTNRPRSARFRQPISSR